MNGGGYFADAGPHLVSELLWITGLRPKRVAALMDALPVDMRVAISFEMEGGAIATITSIGDSHFEKRRVRNVFSASHGTISIIHPEFETHIQVQGMEPVKFREADLMPVAGPVANFIDAIQGRAKLFSPGEHGADVVQVVEAIYQSQPRDGPSHYVLHSPAEKQPRVTSRFARGTKARRNAEETGDEIRTASGKHWRIVKQ